jgi:hypothetical protein
LKTGCSAIKPFRQLQVAPLELSQQAPLGLGIRVKPKNVWIPVLIQQAPLGLGMSVNTRCSAIKPLRQLQAAPLELSQQAPLGLGNVLKTGCSAIISFCN